MTLWTVAHQAPLSMGSHQARILEWVAIPSFRGLPDPGFQPRSPTLQVDSLPSKPPDTGFKIFYDLFVYSFCLRWVLLLCGGFSGCGMLLFIVVHRCLIAVAFLAVEHRLECVDFSSHSTQAW